jgi:hypothetical protein
VDQVGLSVAARACDCCGGADLVAFSDLGDVPVETGNHYATEAEALASPRGRIVLGYCPECAYVRNLAFDESLIDPAAPTDMNLYHSPTFRAFCTSLIEDLSARLHVAGKRLLEIGCAQGEFLRELCAVAGASGVGYDASYAGSEGVDSSGADLRRGVAPMDDDLPAFDAVISRFVLEHVSEPYRFLVQLRSRAEGRPVIGHFQVPDAGYDLATAGWEVIYPHVSYFNESSLRRIAQRAGWRVTSNGPVFSGMIHYIDVEAGAPVSDMAGAAIRDRHLASIRGFDARHHAERQNWLGALGRLVDEGAHPVLWGAGSRGAQLLNYADPQRRVAAVVDVNPTKWGRYLPVTGHRVDDPDSLRGLDTRAVVITNPVYQSEIAKHLAELGLSPRILVA